MNLYDRIDAYKKAIDSIRPFEGETLRMLREYYRIGLTWTSNALEGNTLTEIETKILIEDGLTVGGKPLRDIFEAAGHSEAYSYMFELIQKRMITVKDIKTFHRLFYKHIDEPRAGLWRDIDIIVTGSDYEFPPFAELNGLIDELAAWIKSERSKIHPIRFAAALHLKFITIHPFVDGNGRVARLLMNTALIQDGYLLAVVPPVLHRDYLAFIQNYQKNGNADQFCDFIAERVLESEKELIRLLHIPVSLPNL